MELINRQRRHYYAQLRALADLQDATGSRDAPARLAIEGAVPAPASRPPLAAEDARSSWYDRLQKSQKELI